MPRSNEKYTFQNHLWSCELLTHKTSGNFAKTAQDIDSTED